MRAVFEQAKVILDGEDAYLCVGIPYREAKQFVGNMKPRKYALEIKEYRKSGAWTPMPTPGNSLDSLQPH